MSLCLKIYKNDTGIISFTRSSLIYESLGLKYSEKKNKLEVEKLQHAKEYIENKIKNIEKDIKKYKEVFKNCSELSDMYDVYDLIYEYEDDLDNCYKSKNYIEFLQDMYSEFDNEDQMYYEYY